MISSPGLGVVVDHLSPRQREYTQAIAETVENAANGVGEALIAATDPMYFRRSDHRSLTDDLRYGMEIAVCVSEIYIDVRESPTEKIANALSAIANAMDAAAKRIAAASIPPLEPGLWQKEAGQESTQT